MKAELADEIAPVRAVLRRCSCRHKTNTIADGSLWPGRFDHCQDSEPLVEWHRDATGRQTRHDWRSRRAAQLDSLGLKFVVAQPNLAVAQAGSIVRTCVPNGQLPPDMTKETRSVGRGAPNVRGPTSLSISFVIYGELTEC